MKTSQVGIDLMNNCYTWALDKFFKEDGYICFRKSRSMKTDWAAPLPIRFIGRFIMFIGAVFWSLGLFINTGKIPHTLYLKEEGSDFEHYSLKKAKVYWVPPLAFDGEVKQGDKV